MSMDQSAQAHARRLGRTLLRTRRTAMDIDDIIPNERQPRTGPKEDAELQRQIIANQGLFEPLLIEPHPDVPTKFRIIDGDRRWTNLQLLVEQGLWKNRWVPVEVTDRTLREDERLRVWIYIHRQRKEWEVKEKEMVACRLVEFVGRASAANILGVAVRELDRLVDVFRLSQRFSQLREPDGAISWARELLNINKSVLTPGVIDAVVRKAAQRRITSCKELRKLRTILRDPVARAHFMSEEGTIDSAMVRIVPLPRALGRHGLVADVSALCRSVRSYSWSDLKALRGDEYTYGKLCEAEALLQGIKQMFHPGKEGEPPPGTAPDADAKIEQSAA